MVLLIECHFETLARSLPPPRQTWLQYLKCRRDGESSETTAGCASRQHRKETGEENNAGRNKIQ